MSDTPSRIGLFQSLGFRLGLAVGLALAIGLTAFLVLSMAHHEHALLTLKKEEASLLAHSIENSLHHAMLEGEKGRTTMRQAIRQLGRRPEIDRVRVLNPEGQVQYSTEESEIGRRVELDSEDCRQCHLEGHSMAVGTLDPLQLSYTPAGTGKDGGRVLGMMHPIRNDGQTCTPCHQDTSVLGKLDIVVSLGNLDRDIQLHRGGLILFAVLGIGGTIFVAITAIHRLVHRPVATLLDGTRRIGSLDLSYRIPTDRRDELGNLAQSFNDMTERLQRAQNKIRGFTDSLEAKVEEKTRELQEAQISMLRAEKMAAIGQMAAGVAHEINNPLTGVITFATLLKRQVDDASLAEDLDTIIEEAHRCSKIARGLLDFARGGVLSTTTADVSRVLDRTLALVERQASFHNIEIVRDFAADLPAVTLDEDRIGQVFLNLVMNAAEAMTHGGRLSITTFRSEQDGAEAVGIRFEDTGPGMTEDVAARIFEPFFTTKEPGQGTGLGLSVSYGIVADHGGSIRVEGRPRQGAIFVVTLPVVEEDS